MAKYQQYAEYKDSGVEWLGEIPRDWMATELKRNCKVTDGSHYSPAIEVEGLPFISVTDVGVNKINFIDSKKISDQSFERLVKEGCKPSVGDVLLTKDGTIGRACIVTEQMPDFVILSSLGLLTPSKKLVNKYLYYYLISGINIDQMNSVIHGSALRRMTISKINDLVIAFPQKEEDQTQIASFLDHETAQIDTLIEKQQTLIQLLKEKRQALISHAVTKGLNPDAPMKDSGVEWLGEVPEHWSVIKLSNYAIPLNGDRGANYPSGNDFVDEGVFFISTSEVVDGYIKTDTASKITLKKYNQLGGLKIKKGDIIYCLRGSVGKSGICTFNEGTISSSLMGIRSVSIEPYYLKLLLASSSELQQRSMLVTGSVSANLSAQNVMGYRFAIPEKVEQLMIIAHVENSLEKIDILLSKATQAIQLMQERRIALISAAVTGKIDVRGWRASE